MSNTTTATATYTTPRAYSKKATALQNATRYVIRNNLKLTHTITTQLTANGYTATVTVNAVKLADLPKSLPKVKIMLSVKPLGPVALVHAICANNWGKQRKDILALCAKAGLNKHTAHRQYQVYKTKLANKANKAN